MAFYYNPVTGEVQKVTAAQKEAADSYKRHENIKALISNEKVPTLIAGGVILVSAPTILKIIFDALKKQDDSYDFKEGAINYLTFTKDFAEALFDVTGSGKAFGFFEGEAEDFWSKYVTK
jgi:hypothetical protein